MKHITTRCVATVFLTCAFPCFVFSQNFRTDTARIRQLIAFSQTSKADEILLLHNGRPICHWTNPDCDSLYMGTASMVKSWTGLVLGGMIDRGLIGSTDDPVCKYLPEWKPGCENDIRIRHLLTMSGGLNRRGARGVLSKSDMDAYVLQLKPDTLPDIRFSYSNESVQLLGMLMEKVAGKNADQLFREYLFEPLGMDSTTLMRDSAGNYVVYGGCRTTIEDAARVGMLMLNKGKYQGRQLISAEWIERSVSPSGKAPYYGYLWWLDYQSAHKNFAATGDLGQMTIVFPDLGLVLVRRQNCDTGPESLAMRWMGPDFLALVASTVKAAP
ncbi:MAG: serine hydrolase [Saprospiraceae bacterium]|nr:serine hydrolase [Saprospiraceae bacterium]